MPVAIEVAYPLEMMPGDNRFIAGAVSVGPFSGRLLLEIRCSDVRISDGATPGSGRILLAGQSVEQQRSLHYAADSKCPSPALKELGIFVWQYSIDPWRVAAAVLLCVLLVLPSVVALTQLTLGEVTVTYGRIALASVPLAVLIAMVVTVKRVIPVIEFFYQKGLMRRRLISAQGEYHAIEIVKTAGMAYFRNGKVYFDVE